MPGPENKPIAGTAPYGSDREGLVWGYRFLPGESATPVGTDAMKAPGDEGAFYWLHFSTANAAAEGWLRENLSLPDAFYESLRQESGSTRVERDGDHLVGIFHDALMEFGRETADVSTMHLSVDPRVMVTARLKPLRSVDRLRGSVRAAEAFRSTADLLAHLLRDQADVLVEIIRKCGLQSDAIEDRLIAKQISYSRAELGGLRRVLVRVQRLLAPEPAALFRLLSKPPSWISEDDVQELRQATEEFSEAVADCAALGERVKLLQEELSSVINEQNNRSLFLLTVFTVLALPFNIIGGLFGMNVGGIPFAQHQHGFALIVILLLGFTAAACLIAFRRRGN